MLKSICYLWRKILLINNIDFLLIFICSLLIISETELIMFTKHFFFLLLTDCSWYGSIISRS